MSFSGIADPRPPVLRSRQHGVPGKNASGHILKPKAHSRRIRVMDGRSNTLIAYFDLLNENDRPIIPERAAIKFAEIAAKANRSIKVVIVHLVHARGNQCYFEVSDPCVADNCAILNVAPGEYRVVHDGKTYILGQDDYCYRLVDEPSLQAPIKCLSHYWQAERIISALNP